MGVRTKHYDHKLRSEEESQPQNQPTNELEGANQVLPEAVVAEPAVAAVAGKGKAGKGKRKAKSRAKGKSQPIAPPSVPLAVPKQEPTVSVVAPSPAPKPPVVAVATITPPIETVNKKTTPSKKSSSKKRKQRGGKGKGQQNGKISVNEVATVEKVDSNKNAVDLQGGKSASILTSIKSIPSPPEPSSVPSNVTNGNIHLQPESAPPGNGLKNGILKANKTLKKGMKNLMERTNKILERSRNCKKPSRKKSKSPVKPRILPARASARLCVRKNSGEHEQCMMRSDIPLRTVELIKRPLELREPATKLLYMASLSLYPTADPDSDTTPIVIISEEIPNSCGKKPKMRSMELPLLPNWRSATYHSSSRATVVDDPILLSINAIISPDLKNTNSNYNGIENKPARKRKPAEKKKQPNKEEIVTPKTDLCSSMLRYPVDSGLTISPSVQPRSENQVKLPLSTKFISKSNNQFISVGTFSVDDKVSIPASLSPLAASVPIVEKPQDKQIATSPVSPTVATLAVNSTTTVVENNNTVIQPNKAVKSAPVKRKRKSLETIIKEIPKTKSQNVVGSSSDETLHISELHVTSNSLKLPSINPILEGLMNTPVNNKKRSYKPKTEPIEPLLQAVVMSPLNLQNPVSMTVPLQPAPGNSNINAIAPTSKEQGGKPRNKKQKPQFHLPLPLPIPIPPGLLNYTTLVPNNNLPSNPAPPKPKRQRKPPKPKAPKVTATILGVPTNLPPQQRQPHEIPHHHHQLASIPYLPSHLEAYYHSTPAGIAGNGVKESIMSSMYHHNQDQPMDLDQALDLCVKAQPIVQPKKVKKAKAPAMKSLLKPMNVEEDVPLNLVMARGIPQGGQSTVAGKKPDSKMSPYPIAAENIKQQGNLENVKQMLARLHTKIAPAVNGVQLITIE